MSQIPVNLTSSRFVGLSHSQLNEIIDMVSVCFLGYVTFAFLGCVSVFPASFTPAVFFAALRITEWDEPIAGGASARVFPAREIGGIGGVVHVARNIACMLFILRVVRRFRTLKCRSSLQYSVNIMLHVRVVLVLDISSGERLPYLWTVKGAALFASKVGFIAINFIEVR